MNQLNTLNELVDRKKKVTNLIEQYRRVGIKQFVDRYVALSWMLEADIQKIKKDTPKVNKWKC